MKSAVEQKSRVEEEAEVETLDVEAEAVWSLGRMRGAPEAAEVQAIDRICWLHSMEMQVEQVFSTLAAEGKAKVIELSMAMHLQANK